MQIQLNLVFRVVQILNYICEFKLNMSGNFSAVEEGVAASSSSSAEELEQQPQIDITQIITKIIQIGHLCDIFGFFGILV